MIRSRRAFTLSEMLVVLAILMVLASVLFPVFRSAQEGARRVACASNIKQVVTATILYTSDYDDYFMPVNHRPGTLGDSRNDRTWVQLTLPYVRSFSVFRCPSDPTSSRIQEGVFDEDLVAGDTFSRYYKASTRVNVGYNFLYLAPITWVRNQWVSQPRTTLEIGDPSRTLLFADSAWTEGEKRVATGGGSWLIAPPCRFAKDSSGRVRDSFLRTTNQIEVFSPIEGWRKAPDSNYQYGGAWPWHANRMNVAQVDGSIRSLSTGQLSEGCEVKESWQGLIHDVISYPWDLE